MTYAPGLPRLVVTGRGLLATGNLAALLNDYKLVAATRWQAAPPDAAGVLAWGQRPSARRAAAFAQKNQLPLLRIEDGFLRSVGLGADAPPLSIVLDDLGIYFDARAASRLESLVLQGVDAQQAARAEALRGQWCSARISKYNHARDDAFSGELPVRYVLVADQTAGDASIAAGLADARSFSRMLDAALSAHPDCEILLKVHPDVVAGRKRGHFDLAAVQRRARVRVVADALHPATLIERAAAVYVVTSQLGFEALLHGKPVYTFGMPFYAGWGLTHDVLPAPSRRQSASLAALVHAALIAYPRYIDPETGERCEAERLVEWMALQRRMRMRFPAQVRTRNFSPWKLPALEKFLAGTRTVPLQRRRAVPAGSVVAVWGRPAEGALAAASKVLIIEDGFLRSVGLGADLVQPASWVIDDMGIYYDATRPSRLENLLQETRFDAALCQRAARLRAQICASGITKYNLAGRHWQRPPQAQRVILVPGQVETDASIAWGAPGIKRNIDLLRAVRAAHPDAWLVYKPHPDVVAGVRRRGKGEKSAADFCDEIVVDAPMHTLLDAVDEVHLLTSLTGFEALLRNKPVTCWGQPFYAGWGLTTDMVPVPRRTRRLTCDELVAATLILYPTYISRHSGTFTTPERVLSELQDWRLRGAAPVSAWRRSKRAFMQLRAWLVD